MLRLRLILSQSNYMTQVVDTNYHTKCQTVQLQIRSQLWIYTVSKCRVYSVSAGPGLGTFRSPCASSVQSLSSLFSHIIYIHVWTYKCTMSVLTLSMLDKIFSRRHFQIFSLIFLLFFLRKEDLIFHANCFSCKLPCIKCQSLLSEKNKKKINESSAEFAHRVIMV